MYALYKAVEYVVGSKFPGDFVECGVWRGGSAMVIAHTLMKMKNTGRKIYLYDTFEGMPKPSTEDFRVVDGSSAISQWENEQKKDQLEWGNSIMAFASLPEVKKNMFSTGYPKENFVFVKGKIEETVPDQVPFQIALLRLDTDWYGSTKHEMNYLYPLLVRNGVLLLDDYGHWAGAKKAVDEYFSKNDISMLLNRVDYTGRIGIKIN
jgi:O-methyltransferase